MKSVYYKGLKHTSTAKKRKDLIERAGKYLDSNRWVNEKTGEIKYNFPEAFRDSRWLRKSGSLKKVSNSNSYSNRLKRALGKEWFYTIILSDIKKKWALYETIFDPKEMKAVRKWCDRNIEGPYNATIELCAYNGPHVHIISGAQKNKYLKAPKQVKKRKGLVEYLSKSTFNIKDKFKGMNVEYCIGEEYMVMLGEYLYWKEMMKNRRFPNKSWTVLKPSGNKEKKGMGSGVCTVHIDPFFPDLNLTQAS